MAPEHRIDLCVIGGCGHVGLPLALAFADSGLRVGIHDIDETKMTAVREGTMPFRESGGPELLDRVLSSGRLELSSDPSLVKESAVVVIVIGTPIDEFLNPSIRVFERVLDGAAPWLADGALVILRSTVYPGTTDWVATTLAERGVRAEVVFCPERIAEGHAIEELGQLPQIVGTNSESAFAQAESLFAHLGVASIRTTPLEAELAKLFTNAWRYMKFAVANQFFMIAQEANVDYSRLLHAIRHDYPRASDLPGPGLAAGPCLLKDTMQLSGFTGKNFVLGHAAMLINESLPEFLVKELERTMSLRGKTVAILGMAFKAESDDVRASLSYRLRKTLWFAGARVLCTDPYVESPDLVDLDAALAEADVVFIAAPHRQYRNLDLTGKVVVDIWGVSGAIRVG